MGKPYTGSLICFTNPALSKLLFKCRYAIHNTSIFVLQIGYCLNYRYSVIRNEAIYAKITLY